VLDDDDDEVVRSSSNLFNLIFSFVVFLLLLLLLVFIADDEDEVFLFEIESNSECVATIEQVVGFKDDADELILFVDWLTKSFSI
jgi:hypothetical protein